jgi:hypothetical protein
VVKKEDKLKSFVNYFAKENWYDFDCWSWQLWNWIQKHKT